MQLTPKQKELQEMYAEAFEAGMEVEQTRCFTHLELARAAGAKPDRAIEHGHTPEQRLESYAASAIEHGTRREFAKKCLELGYTPPASVASALEAKDTPPVASRAESMIQQAIGAKNTGAGKVDIGDQVAAIMAEARGQSPSTTTMTTDTASSVAGGADLGDQVVALMAAKRGKALENSQ